MKSLGWSFGEMWSGRGRTPFPGVSGAVCILQKVSCFPKVKNMLERLMGHRVKVTRVDDEIRVAAADEEMNR